MRMVDHSQNYTKSSIFLGAKHSSHPSRFERKLSHLLSCLLRTRAGLKHRHSESVDLENIRRKISRYNGQSPPRPKKQKKV